MKISWSSSILTVSELAGDMYLPTYSCEVQTIPLIVFVFFCTAYLKRIFFLISNIGKILIVHFVFIHTEWTVSEFDLVIPWSLWRWYLFIGIVWCCRFDDYPKSQMCCYNYVRINHLKHVKWSRKNWVIIYHLQCFSVFDKHTCDLFFFPTLYITFPHVKLKTM